MKRKYMHRIAAFVFIVSVSCAAVIMIFNVILFMSGLAKEQIVWIFSVVAAGISGLYLILEERDE